MSVGETISNERYLVILELNPDEIRFYSIPSWEVNLEINTLKAAHGKMINVDPDTEEVGIICDYLSEGGKWEKYLLDSSELPRSSFVGVYHVGFMI